MSLFFQITKDPDADLDYSIDWTAWFTGAETISTSTWTAYPTDITMHSDGLDVSNKIATVWLSGGSLANPRGGYEITNRIVTTASRTEERSIRVFMVQR